MEKTEQIIKAEAPHSVKFSINAKGQLSAECKVYAEDPNNALDKSIDIKDKLLKLIKDTNRL